MFLTNAQNVGSVVVADGCGGLVVIVLTFFSDDPRSNPVQGRVVCHIKWKERKKANAQNQIDEF